MKQCQSCGGRYEEIGPGGYRYFHVCPPVLEVEIERAGEARFVKLTDVQPTDTITVLRDGKKTKTTAADQRDGDMRVNDRTAARDNSRDENVKISGYKKDGTAITTVQREGRGTIDVTDRIEADGVRR